jgi:hypothetical protein
VIGTTGQRLGGIGVEVVCDPGGIGLGRKGMGSAYSAKPNSLLQRRKGGSAGRFVGTREEAGGTPSHIGTQAAQAFHGLKEQRIVQVTSSLKMSAQMPGLPAIHL